MLTLNNVPFLLGTRNLQSQVSTIKENFITAQTEAVTGRVADLSEALHGDVGRVHRLQKLIALTERRAETLASARNEFQFVQTTLTSAREKAADTALDVQGALGLEDDTSLAAHASTARAELESIFGQLNTSFAGKHLFSGAAVNTAPLGDVDTLITDIEGIIAAAPDLATANTNLDTYFGAGGGFETTIYQGSTSAGPTREVADGRRVGVEATPLDAGLLNTIRGLAVVATARDQAATEAIGDGLLNAAATTLGSASQSLLLQQADIGAIEEDLTLLTTRNEAAQTTYELFLNELIGRDQYEAATEMANLETQLEAAYLATSRIADLSLANYLR